MDEKTLPRDLRTLRLDNILYLLIFHKLSINLLIIRYSKTNLENIYYLSYTSIVSKPTTVSNQTASTIQPASAATKATTKPRKNMDGLGKLRNGMLRET